MAKKKYSNKFDTFIEVTDKGLLAEYLSGKGIAFDKKKELNTDYAHELLDGLKTEDERIDIVEEAECMEDLASDFFPQIREYVLEEPAKYPLSWTDKESNETIVLRIFLKIKNAYKLIYDLFLCDQFWARLHHYPLEAQQVRFDQKHIDDFKSELQKYLNDEKKQTGGCYIREREYNDRQYILILRGDEQKTVTVLSENGESKVHRVFRPAKEDMIVYDKEHSMIAMSPSIGGTKNKLFYANAFNKHILGGDKIGKEFFSEDGQLVDLKPIFEKSFYERTKDIKEIKLVSVFAVKNGSPWTEITVKSDDVLESIKALDLHINKNEAVSVKIEVCIEGLKRAIPVSLTGRSTGQIKGRKEREIIEGFLREKKVIAF
jgi:hypothetical protein